MTINKKPGDAGGRTPGLQKHSTKHHSNVNTAAQRARLLDALKRRALTTLQARRELDVLHVAARIMELRRGGYSIETAWTRDVTSVEHLHRVARYELVGEQAQQELFPQVDG